MRCHLPYCHLPSPFVCTLDCLIVSFVSSSFLFLFLSWICTILQMKHFKTLLLETEISMYATFFPTILQEKTIKRIGVVSLFVIILSLSSNNFSITVVPPCPLLLGLSNKMFHDSDDVYYPILIYAYFSTYLFKIFFLPPFFSSIFSKYMLYHKHPLLYICNSVSNKFLKTFFSFSLSPLWQF